MDEKEGRFIDWAIKFKIDKFPLTEGEWNTIKTGFLDMDSRIKELEEGIEYLPKDKIEEAQRIMRENDFVIDNLDNKWQKLCFTFYTDICDMQTKIGELYNLIEKEKP